MNLPLRLVPAGVLQLVRDAVAVRAGPRPRACAFEAAGRRIPAWLYVSEERGPAALLFHTASGVTPHDHRFAQRLREAGFATLLVRYSGRTRGAVLESDAHRRTLDLIAGAALRQLRAQPEVGGGPVAAIGLSLGGYLAASLTGAAARVQAAVIYYGVYAASEPMLEAYPGPLLVVQGTRDSEAFVERAKRAAARNRHSQLALLQDAVHQFDLFQPSSATSRDAWARTVAFLGEALRTGR